LTYIMGLAAFLALGCLRRRRQGLMLVGFRARPASHTSIVQAGATIGCSGLRSKTGEGQKELPSFGGKLFGDWPRRPVEVLGTIDPGTTAHYNCTGRRWLRLPYKEWERPAPWSPTVRATRDSSTTSESRSTPCGPISYGHFLRFLE